MRINSGAEDLPDPGMRHGRGRARCFAGTVRGDFVEQLAGWFTDESTWPRDRSFDVFCRWFDFQHHSVLVDLCDELLIDESD